MIKEIEVALPDGTFVTYYGEVSSLDFNTGKLEFLAIPKIPPTPIAITTSKEE